MFPAGQILWMLIGIPLFVIVIFAVVAILIIRSFRQGKEFSKLISKRQVPNGIKEKMLSSLDNYVPVKIGINEIIHNLGSFKVPEYYSSGPSGSKTTFWMYPILSWDNAFDFKNSFLKCFSYARIKNLNFFDYGLISQYAAIKVSDGLIESYFANNKMAVIFNGKSYGYFDFKTHQIISDLNIKIGTFDVPDTTSLRSLSVNSIEVQFNLKANIFIDNKKIASILLQTSTFENIKILKDSLLKNKNFDVNIFQELNIQSPEQSILVIGFGISFYALLENLRPDK